MTDASTNGSEAKRSPRAILICAALVLVVLLVYGKVSHCGFLRWDDNLYVTENQHVATGLSGNNIAWALAETGTFYWHPVTWLSHMLDCQLFGLSPGSHHLVNMALHLISAMLLFLLLFKATRSFWRSSVVAALFATHPLNVETVAWISERKSLLSLLFSLLTIAAYGWYTKKPSTKKYGTVAGFFLLALMSKPMALTLPLVLLLLDYWPLNRFGESLKEGSVVTLIVEKVPLLLMSVASAALTIIGQRTAQAMSSLSTVPVAMRLEQALVSYVIYLRKLFWPADLAAFYPYRPHWVPWPALLATLVVLIGITALAIHFRRARFVLMGWLLFVVTLLPVSGIVQVGRVVIADRFAYVPAIGIFIALVWICGDLVERYSLKPAIPAVISVAIVMALALTARDYAKYWENGVALFTHAAVVEKAPDSMLEDMIADALVADHQIDEAFAHYRKSCELDPQFDLCHYNMAEILFSRYAVSAALEHYQLAGRYTKSPQMALNCLVNSGEALLDLGDLDSAERQLSYALSLDPQNPGANRLMAQVNARRGAR
ncbi:MAG TPA: hypothetical protein VFU86_01165 [Terriglobales bacterium]|nr:hypothetical protein [Terriglobales bacterium]